MSAVCCGSGQDGKAEAVREPAEGSGRRLAHLLTKASQLYDFMVSQSIDIREDNADEVKLKLALWLVQTFGTYGK